MIVGFSKHGRGRAGKAVGYLVDRMRKGVERQPAPTVLRGDPALITELIDSLPFKHRYTSGVLSFTPGEVVAPDVEQKIMDGFEAAAFAGLEPDRYAILWVRHEHAGHHELNFLVARVELETGRSLNIAPPGKASRKLFDAFRSTINHEFGFADPDDPERARAVRLPAHVAKFHAAELRAGREAGRDPREQIVESVIQAAVIGQIRSRTDVIAYLSGAGLEINRQGVDYISVRNPYETDPKVNNKYRLKGPCFHAGFDARQLTRPSQTRTRESGDARDKRSRQSREQLHERTESRAAYHKNRYGESPKLERGATLILPDIVPELTLQQTVEAVANQWNFRSGNQLGGSDGRERDLEQKRLDDSSGTRASAPDKAAEEATRGLHYSRGQDGSVSGDSPEDSRQQALSVRERQVSVRESKGAITNDRDRTSAFERGGALNERIRSAKSRLASGIRSHGERFNQAVRRHDEASGQHDRTHEWARSNMLSLIRASKLLEQTAEKLREFVREVKERLVELERRSRSRGFER